MPITLMAATIALACCAALATLAHPVPGVEHECIHDSPRFAAERARLLRRRPVVQHYHAAVASRAFHAEQVAGPNGTNATATAASGASTAGNASSNAATPPPNVSTAAPASAIINTTTTRLLTTTTAAPTFTTTPKPLRIVFRYDTLTTPGSYCSRLGEEVPDFITAGATVNCSSPSDILTEEKRSVLRDRILPSALARIQAHVGMLYPVASNLVIPSRDVCGHGFAIAPEDTIQGVPNADLVIYVAAGPIQGATAAFAASCAKDQLDRSVIGRINYDAELLVWDEANMAANQVLIDIATHEIFHVLGVSNAELSKPGRVATATKRGKTVILVQTPSVLAYVRQFTGCATLDGAELEDQGTSSSSGSHWERKLYMDELMCAVVGPRVSGLSLGFLNDIGVGYAIDLAGEPMNWGRDTGCGVHDFRCDTVQGGRDKYFCFADPGGPFPSQCTADLTGIGACSVTTHSTDLPPHFRYYANPRVGGPAYMDGCPLVTPYSNRACSVPAEATTNERIFGFTFNTSSRCFNSTGVIQQGFASPSADGPRCFEALCVGQSTVQFRIRGSEYVTCGAAGSTVAAPSTYNGRVVCPDPRQMCTSLGAVTPAPYYTVAVPTAGPQTFTVPPATPSPTTLPPVAPPAPRSTTVNGGFVVPGNAFGLLASDPIAWTNLAAALRSDVADLLSVDVTRVGITSLRVGSLIVNFSTDATDEVLPLTVGTVRGFVNIYDPLPRATREYQRVSPTTPRLTISQAAASGAFSRTLHPGIFVALGVALLFATLSG